MPFKLFPINRLLDNPRLIQFKGFLISRILYSLILFASIPFFTRLLSPEAYGIVAILISVQAFASLFVNFNMHAEASVNFYNFNANKFRDYTNTLAFLLCINAFAVCFLAYIFRTPLSSFLPFSNIWIYGITTTAIFNFFYLFNQAYSQVSRKIVRFAIFENLYAALPIFFSIALISVASQPWQGRAWGLLLGQAFVGFLSFLKLNSHGLFNRLQPRLIFIRNTISYCLPLVPHTLAGISMVYAYQYIITSRLGLGEAGIYALIMQICLAPMIFSESINKALTPWIYEKIPNYRENALLIWRILALACLLHIGFSFVFSVSIFHAWPYFFPDSYKITFPLLLTLASASGLFGCYSSISLLLFGGRKTYMIPVISISSTLLSLYIAYTYGYTFGLFGVSICTFINYFLLFILSFIFSSRFFPLPHFRI